MKKSKELELAGIAAGLHMMQPTTSRADELIACLEGEVKSRDARIAELELPYTKMCERMWELESERDQLRAELALSKAAYESAEDEHTKACAELAAIKGSSAVIPAGYSLVPSSIELSHKDIAAIMFMCGGDPDATELDEQFRGGTLWIGGIDDDGELIYGMHLSCTKCPEEGGSTIAEFAAPVAKLQVYECPRCGTGMQVDDSAKPTKPKAQGCTKPGCFPYCDCGGIDDAPVAKQVVMPNREWLQSDGLIYSLENDVNYYEINVTQAAGNRHDGRRAEFAGKLIALLNAADQEGGI